MLNLATGGYAEQAVIDQLHARSGSREVRVRYDLLNQYDLVIGELAAESGGRVDMSATADIKRTAQFVVPDADANNIDWLNDRIRPVFCLKMPDDGWAEWSLGVFLLSSPSRRSTGTGVTRSVEAYDASLILKEDKFDSRYRLLATSTYTDAVNNILGTAGIWRVNLVAHGGTLGVDKEFEIGTSKLDAINQLLSEINYTSLWVDELGFFTARPYVIPTDAEAAYTYQDNDLSVIHPGASEELDLFAVPNKWVVTASNPEKAALVSRYVNDQITSKTSTVSRNRTIVDFRTIDDVLDQATLDAYTKRVAYEASQVYGKVVFDTAVMPHHSFMDTLFVQHTELAVSGKYTEVGWSIDLSPGGRMTHTVRGVIHI